MAFTVTVDKTKGDSFFFIVSGGQGKPSISCYSMITPKAKLIDFVATVDGKVNVAGATQNNDKMKNCLNTLAAPKKDMLRFLQDDCSPIPAGKCSNDFKTGCQKTGFFDNFQKVVCPTITLLNATQQLLRLRLQVTG